MASLVADYGSSASDSEEKSDESRESSPDSDEERPNKEPGMKSDDRPKLPGPSFQLTTSSVFSNPFREEEVAQATILERHVKMTTPVSQQTTVNGKQICWNYRKGRCRFGHNCKYVHDSDVVNLPGATQEPEPAEPEVVAASAAGASQQGQPSQSRKNKRPGLSDSVVPSKKAMKFYHKTQGKS